MTAQARPQPIAAGDDMSRSPDLVAENLEKLKALFPELVTEGKNGVSLNLDVLKALVGDQTVSDAEEKYGLNWHGKRQARQLALTPSTGTLRPCPEESVDWEKTQNLMIEGDNLEVLKLLQKSYAGKVKLIYIDPPYNTGKDFVYPDNFQDNIKNYLELTGQVDGEGRKLSSNTEASGRFHTDWLNMMYPRLRLARDLLREDGVVFVSISDKELNNLKLLMDEIFGSELFVGVITVVNNMKGRNDKKHIAACHEYLMTYAMRNFASNGLPLTDEQRAAFKHVDEDGNRYALRDLRKRGGPDKREDRPNMHFPIFWNESTGRCSLTRVTDKDIEILPLRGDASEGCWRWGKDKVSAYIDWLHPRRSERTGRLDVEHRVYLDPSIDIRFPSDFDVDSDDNEDDDGEDDDVVERTSKPKSIWLGGEFSTDSGKRALKAHMPGEVFDFPKAIDFLRTCVLLGSSEEHVCLDMFSGSGAFAESVAIQNRIDSARRRCISVQLPAPLDPSDKKQRAAIAFCKKLGRPQRISELTKERLRRAGQKIRAENPMFAGDTGFRVFKLDSSNIKAWDPETSDLEKTLLDHLESVKEGRSEQDVLYELLLKLGLDLCVPVETKKLAGKMVHCVGGGALFTCLDKKIAVQDAEPLALGIAEWRKALNPASETTCVFRDGAFANDVAKTNLAEILKQHGVEKVRSL